MTVPAQSVPYDTDIAQAAALIADPTRAAMLRALVSGRPLAAAELARPAGVSAAARTCYDHLAGRAGVELLEALVRHGLLTREKAKSLSRTGSGDTVTATRFEATGPERGRLPRSG
jgi:DNA-binding transcriptional ArsR family regulator